MNAQRPCPFATCRWALWPETGHGGSGAGSVPKTDPLTLKHTCVLDVVESGATGAGEGRGMTLEEVGKVLRLTRERVRQIETVASTKVRQNPMAHDAMDLATMLTGYSEPTMPPGGPLFTTAERHIVRRLRPEGQGHDMLLCKRTGCTRPVRPRLGGHGARRAAGYCSYACAHLDGALPPPPGLAGIAVIPQGRAAAPQGLA